MDGIYPGLTVSEELGVGEKRGIKICRNRRQGGGDWTSNLALGMLEETARRKFSLTHTHVSQFAGRNTRTLAPREETKKKQLNIREKLTTRKRRNQANKRRQEKSAGLQAWKAKADTLQNKKSRRVTVASTYQKRTFIAKS